MKLKKIKKLFKVISFLGLRNTIKYIRGNYEIAYKNMFNKYLSDIELKKELESVEDYKVYTFWWQGIDSAPTIIKSCIYKMKDVFKEKLVILDQWNYEEYVKIDNFILDLLKNNKIGIATFSDIIRLKLLSENKCIWFDSSIIIFNNIPIEEIFSYKIYTAHTVSGQKWEMLHHGKFSSFFLATNVKNSTFFQKCAHIYIKLLEDKKCIIDYLTIDIIFSFLYNNDAETKELVDNIPENNKCEFLSKFSYNLNKEFVVSEYNKITSECYINKSTYRVTPPLMYTSSNNETFYNHILKQNLNCFNKYVYDIGKLSIVIPIYNAEKYLNQTLESLINQTYQNLEIILVNDGSTDKSEEVCLKYSKLDNRIKYIKQNNSGVVSAYKAGINIATGKYLAFVDADDYLDYDMYRVLLSKFKFDVEMVVCEYFHVFGDELSKSNSGINEGIYSSESDILQPEMNKRYVTTSRWNKIYLTRVVMSFFDELDNNILFGEDNIFSLLYYSKINKFYFCEQPLYYYRINNLSVSKGLDIDKFYNVIKFYELLRSYNLNYNIDSIALHASWLIISESKRLKIKFSEKIKILKMITGSKYFKEFKENGKWSCHSLREVCVRFSTCHPIVYVTLSNLENLIKNRKKG